MYFFKWLSGKPAAGHSSRYYCYNFHFFLKEFSIAFVNKIASVQNGINLKPLLIYFFTSESEFFKTCIPNGILFFLESFFI